MKVKKKIIALFLALFLSFTSYFIYKHPQAKQEIHIAMIGPIYTSTGRHMRQGVEVYLKYIKDTGYLKGKKIVLDQYDDQNDPIIAKKKALQIIKDNRAVAVIGHNFSSCSISASPIYRKNKIPVITTTAANKDVTKGNDWYFSLISNSNKQAKFLSNYIQLFFKDRNLFVIHEGTTYGRAMAGYIESELNENNRLIAKKWITKVGDNLDEKDLDIIVNDFISLKDKKSLIILVMQSHEGTRVVKKLKDAGVDNIIFGSDSFASKSFIKGFEKYKKEKLNAGHYSNDIYVLSPLIFDTVGDNAQRFQEEYINTYHEKPSWQSAFSFDAAMLIVHALKKQELLLRKNTIAKTRYLIKEFFLSLSEVNYLDGISGHTYFDEIGDISKPFFIGLYQENTVISAPKQIHTLKNPHNLFNLNSLIKKGQILKLNNEYINVMNVVYTGISIKKITNFDHKLMTFNLDGVIWFRFQDNFDVKEIEFLNAVDKIDLGIPLKNITIGNVKYQSYEFSGTFRSDFINGYNLFGEHLLGISFRHKKLDKRFFLYAIDNIGMGVNKKNTLTHLQNTKQIFADDQKVRIKKAHFFQDTYSASSMGSPNYVNNKNNIINFSKINAYLIIAKNTISLIGLLTENLTINLLLFLLVIFLFIYKKFSTNSKSLWVVRTLLIFFSLHLIEIKVINYAYPEMPEFQLINLVKCFNISWWIFAAFIFNSAILNFFIIPYQNKTFRVVPSIIKRFIAITIYLITILCIKSFIFGQELTGLLATSGLIVMVIGLAIKANISNVFSGIAINIERPFRLGDWIKVADFTEGKVIDITWRSTILRIRNGSTTSIPNGLVSDSVILNFNLPSNECSIFFIVNIDTKYNYKEIEGILLKAVQKTEGVLKDPMPQASFKRFSDWSAEYVVSFYIKDYSLKYQVTKNIWKQIFEHLQDAKIVPLTKRQDIRLIKSDENRKKSWYK